MRAVVQRVSQAAVRVDNKIVGEINSGLLVLLGVTHEDGEKEAKWLAEKIAKLRIFSDEDGKMNLSAFDIKGSILVVSQFTLYGNCRRGARPSFSDAAPPEQAELLYEYFCKELAAKEIPIAKGVFQAHMEVSLINDGPVTLIVSTP